MDRTSGGVTPELRVVSPHTALKLLHAPEVGYNSFLYLVVLCVKCISLLNVHCAIRRI